MSLTIMPNADRPHGGYATLTVGAGELGVTEVTVSVFDAYSERHLGGRGWQADPVAFGPYPVTKTPAGMEIVIGPEIVNQLEEYAALKITLGDKSYTTTWPDDVVPAPGAARLGDIFTGGPREAQEAVHAAVRMPKPGAATQDAAVDETPQAGTGGAIGTDPARYGAPPVIIDPDETPRKSGAMLWIAALVAIVALAGAAWFLLRDDAAPPPQTAAVPTAPAPTPAAPPADRCGPDAFAALSGQGFAVTEALLRDCGSAVSPDTALTLLERAARGGDPAALALFGKIYDGNVTVPGLEDRVGLTFGDNPATAARYYARGRDAGSTEATALLGDVCARLATMTGTLERSAFSDHCAN